MSRRQERLLAPGLVVIALVAAVVSSVGAPLIPRIAEDLGTSLGGAQWSLTVALIVGAVAAPLLGRLGDGPARRATLRAGLAAVTAGGVLSACAGSLAVLLVGRTLQGVGLALLPLTMAVARDHLPPDRAPAAIATLSITTAVGIGLGYPLTGLVADHGGAEAAFALSAGASAVALLVAWLVVPDSRHLPRLPRTDAVGAGLLTAGLVALLLGLEQGADWGWGSPATLALLGGALVVLAGWSRRSLRTPEPLVDLRLLRRPAVLTANATAFLVGIAMYLSLALVTQYVQRPDALDASVLVAGLALLPLSATSLAVSQVAPAIERRIGARATLPFGAVAIAAAMTSFALWSDELWQVLLATALLGIGLGGTFAAMPALILGAVRGPETSRAMGLYQVTRYVGFALGSGLAVTLLRAFGDGAEPTVGAYGSTMLVGAGLALAGAVVAWVLPGRGAPAPAVEPSPRRTAEEGRLGAAGLEMLPDPDPLPPHDDPPEAADRDGRAPSS